MKFNCVLHRKQIIIFGNQADENDFPPIRTTNLCAGALLTNTNPKILPGNPGVSGICLSTVTVWFSTIFDLFPI